jgi:hypothetical protein
MLLVVYRLVAIRETKHVEADGKRAKRHGQRDEPCQNAGQRLE